MTKYLLKIRDRSGRDYSNVLSFKLKEKRDETASQMITADGASPEELADCLRQLEDSYPVEFEATEYEYMIQYKDADHDS
jgi:hypothetical protein